MALPTSYDETSLSVFMLLSTRAVANALCWGVDDYSEAINEALITYGVSDVADATDIPRLRAIAKVSAWKAIVDATVTDIQFAADGASFSTQQRHAQAVAALSRAQNELALVLGTEAEADAAAAVVKVGALRYSDAYGSRDDVRH